MCICLVGVNYYREEVHPNPDGPAIREKRSLNGALWYGLLKYNQAVNRLSQIPESAGGEHGFMCQQ
jgi:hypothetical protein